MVVSADTYETLPQAALRLFRERILGEDPESVEKNQFSFWEVADAGVTRINDLTGTQMDINRNYNAEGKLERVAFNSWLVDFTAPLK